MSTRKGAGNTRTRKPAHQNSFAFRHNPKSQKTAKILASINMGLCASCHDKVEWRKKYRKYRPLRKPATCNDCHNKTVTAAYHRICAPCAKQRRVCPFCCTKGRPRAEAEADGEEGGNDGDEEEDAMSEEGEGGKGKGKATGSSDGDGNGDEHGVSMEGGGGGISGVEMGNEGGGSGTGSKGKAVGEEKSDNRMDDSDSGDA